MGNFIETLYDIIFQPAKAMRDIAGDKRMKQAFAAFFLSMLLPFGAVYLGLRFSSMQGAASFMMTVQVIVGLIMWFAGAAIFGLTAELFGGRGSAAGLFAAMGFIHVPRLLAIPVGVAAVLASSGYRPFLMMGVWLLVTFWTFYLELLAIKGSYNMSGVQAILVMLFPFAALLMLGLLVVFFIGASLMSIMPMRWMQ